MRRTSKFQAQDVIKRGSIYVRCTLQSNGLGKGKIFPEVTIKLIQKLYRSLFIYCETTTIFLAHKTVLPDTLELV